MFSIDGLIAILMFLFFRPAYFLYSPFTVLVLFLLCLAWVKETRHAPGAWFLGVMLFVVVFPFLWAVLFYTTVVVFRFLLLIIPLVTHGWQRGALRRGFA